MFPKFISAPLLRSFFFAVFSRTICSKISATLYCGIFKNHLDGIVTFLIFSLLGESKILYDEKWSETSYYCIGECRNMVCLHCVEKLKLIFDLNFWTKEFHKIKFRER